MREHLDRQEQAQQAIREGERRYRSLIENITDYAIFMTDATGPHQHAGMTARRPSSATRRTKLSGQTLRSVFSTQDDIDSAKTQREIELAMRSGRAASDGWKMRKNGMRLFIEGVSVTVVDESGQLAGVAHFLRDITDKRRIATEREQLLESERAARSEAERASRTKDEFLATLSHELRTPLNAILGWTQVLRKTKGLPESAANALNVIERNARAQAQIIEDLLDMSSIISGKVRLDVQRMDLAVGHRRHRRKPCGPPPQAKGIRLQVVLDPMAGPVRGDPNRLQQVLWNLLTNAVKFTPKDGRVP